MTIEDAIAIVDIALQHKRLSNIRCHDGPQ